MTDTAPLFSFGIIADPQYANIADRPDMDRYYAASLDKLSEAIDVFNAEDLAFVVTLGDLVDGGWTEFDAVLGRYEALRHRSVLIPGNHDFAVEPQHLADVHRRLGMGSAFYEFTHGRVRFVIVDGSDVSTFAPPPGDPRRTLAQERLDALKRAGSINAQDWNGSLGDEQRAWLEATLATADARGEAVVIFCHYPLHPQNAHNMWDAPELLSLLAAHPSVKAWFCGHNHAGNYGVVGNTHFVTFKGMVDTKDANSFAIADIYENRIDIRGFGREPSRTLRL